MKRLVGILVVLVVVGLLAAGVYWRINGRKAEGEAGSAGAGEAPFVASADEFSTAMPIAVAGVPVVRDTMVLAVTAQGQAAALRQATLTAQVSGQVLAVPVRESVAVGAGATLVRIDGAEHVLNLREAEAALAQARRQYEELTLGDDRIADPEVRASRARAAREKAGLDAREVGVERARYNLSHTQVRAPFAGRVANLRVVPGQWVRAGDELVAVVELDPIRIEVDVLEGDIGFLSPGGGANVVFAAFPGETFRGRIETINPIVDERKRTARVTVSVPNPQARILPGFFARVTLDARRLPDRVMVPREAVIERDRRTLVFLFEPAGDAGTAMWQYVRTGLENATHVEIIEDPEDPSTRMLRPGEIVLVDGHYTLTHGARVQLVENVSAEGGRPR
jgi:membrane fusion protein (multidrug efflux system)